MKIPKSEIRIAPQHPSLYPDLRQEDALCAPVVIDASRTLVDGYRRFRILPQDEIAVVELGAVPLFETALALNLRSRLWDEIDCFFWNRWALSLGVPVNLPLMRFPEELDSADEPLLKLIANRKLTLRQAALILQSPMPYRPFFQSFLSDSIRLNNNETAAFMNLCIDLKQMLHLVRIEDLIAKVEEGVPANDARSRGDRLLKAMRVLRYPYYQKKLGEFATSWRLLELGGNVQADRSQFLERGKLQITITSGSYQELKKSVEKLSSSMESPLWRKIWEE